MSGVYAHAGRRINERPGGTWRAAGAFAEYA